MKFFTSLFFFILLAGTLQATDLKNAESKPETMVEATLSSDQRPLAIIRRFRPDVAVSASEGAWIAPTNAQQLFASDTLRTGEEGFAVVQFMDNSIAKMRPNSMLIITGEVGRDGSTAARLALELGEVFMEVRGRNSNYEVDFGNGVAAVRGTGFNTQRTTTGSNISVISGLVEVTSITGESMQVGANTMASVTPQGQLTSQPIPQDVLDNINQVNNQMDEPQTPADEKSILLRFTNDEGQTIQIRVRYRENE